MVMEMANKIAMDSVMNYELIHRENNGHCAKVVQRFQNATFRMGMAVEMKLMRVGLVFAQGRQSSDYIQRH